MEKYKPLDDLTNNYLVLASEVLVQARKDYWKPWGASWGDSPRKKPPKSVIDARRREIRQFFMSPKYEFYADILGIEMDGEEYFDKYVLNYKKPGGSNMQDRIRGT